jgi:hypothetical protein
VIHSATRNQPTAYALTEKGTGAMLTAHLAITKQTVGTVSASMRVRGHAVRGARVTAVARRGARVTAVALLPDGRQRSIRLASVQRHGRHYQATTKLSLTPGQRPLEVIIHATRVQTSLTALATADGTGVWN